MRSRHVLYVMGLLCICLAPQQVLACNTVTRWVEQALDAVRAGNLSTPAAGRAYAMTTIAMYDAINGIDRVHRLSKREQALVPSTGAPLLGDRRAAAAAAAHAVLLALIPTQAERLDTALADDLNALGGTGRTTVARGHEWGEQVGQQVVALRADDGTQVAETQPAGSGPGAFPRPFSGAQYRDMVPFGVDDTTPYASGGPPELESAAYATAFNEVKQLGSSADTDPERAAIALHWQAENNTARETGLWFKAALDIVERKGTAFFLSPTARLFALLGMGIADGVAVSWADKFGFHFWRPGDAIRAASTDGNPNTDEDATWTPRGGSLGGTPEHTSGTSTFAGAAASILAGFYCRDKVSFSFKGELGTPPRAYTHFSQAADEAGRSRIYNGLHFEFSNRAGREAGDGIGTEIVTTRLRRPGDC